VSATREDTPGVNTWCEYVPGKKGARAPDAACTPAHVTGLPAAPARINCELALVRPPEVCK
jgi:hypothetical protein